MQVYIKKEKFEEALARKNISQDDFAKILGVTRPYISTLKDPEKYDLSPSPELREKMLNFLGVEFDVIFFIQNGRFGDNSSKEQSDGQPNQDN